ncbi:MAG: hypothetical protein WC380_12460 [Pedobacter sp.]
MSKKTDTSIRYQDTKQKINDCRLTIDEVPEYARYPAASGM